MRKAQIQRRHAMDVTKIETLHGLLVVEQQLARSHAVMSDTQSIYAGGREASYRFAIEAMEMRWPHLEARRIDMEEVFNQ